MAHAQPMSTSVTTRLASLWVQQLEQLGLRIFDKKALQAECDGWLELLENTLNGQESAEGELQRLISLYGRSLGASGKPASVCFSQFTALEDCIRSVYPEKPQALSLARRLGNLAADAHALGASQRREAQQTQELSKNMPVFAWEDSLVAGIYVGKLQADTLDALLARMFMLAISRGSAVAALELSFSTVDDSLLLETMRGYLSHELAPRLLLKVCGPQNIKRLFAQLPEGHQRSIQYQGSLQELLTTSPA